jgi:4-amino-4-deoxy-L-arabinose transferase-like glycosyltransferase
MSLGAAPPALGPAKQSALADVRFTAEPDMPSWLAVALLLALCGFLFFYGLTAGELYRTESLRAIIAAEFLRSGNWVVPTLYGEPLFTKPPGMYAAIALVSLPFGGVSEWTARLPSALSATAAVFLVYWYFGRQLGRRGGLVAAVILPTSFMWLDKATAAEIDMMQAAWVTAAVVFFLRALEAEEDSEVAQRTIIHQYRVSANGTILEGSPPILAPDVLPRQSCWPWWLAALICVAGGVLTKWTAPAFFYGTAVPLLWWRGRLRLLVGRHHLVSAAVGAGICLAWIGVAVALTGWHAFYDTVSREAMMRLLPSHHYRPYPWRETLAHPFKVFAANLPWAVVALLALRPGFMQLWDERGRWLLQAMHCWIWPNLLFWTVIPEHASRHSFPLFPGFAGLAALVVVAWLTGRLPWPISRVGWKRVLQPGTLLLVILAVWLAAKVVFVEAVTPARNRNREPRAKGELLAALVPKGQTLYLFRLKDEGIMFYYGRTVRRLKGVEELPSSGEPLYCILDESEWRQDWPWQWAKVMKHLRDEQGDPIVLVELPAAALDFPEEGLSP